ncbi:crossover junction endodeoxyribonuclease RuvC [Phototrophicus methaneseepsis]|uniref:Crossover junction endodeoxyribonuclease RuvC n=1 Tax=Phototrophicus methaneseepsis TaxID=2710758 RepID=A0A7S8E665_9CHLR|nr:crossover junction endodeoxyribonuclease RuvC [Phototrophicus methaneseepsis]QPC81116.1 crossover junction endodeoxyribonuclease RuvC [Phototrophicus methaneseepsis]
MLSLGIDPGTAIVGYGFVYEHNDGSLEAVHYGVIRTPAKTPMPERLHTIYSELTQLIQQYQPQSAGVEELFFARNVTTAITVAQSRGCILLALQQAGIRIHEYKPNIVKQSISGYGGADKPQMQEMVRVLLNLEKIPRPDDAADALAIAITDIHTSRYNSGYDLA